MAIAEKTTKKFNRKNSMKGLPRRKKLTLESVGDTIYYEAAWYGEDIPLMVNGCTDGTIFRNHMEDADVILHYADFEGDLGFTIPANSALVSSTIFEEGSFSLTCERHESLESNMRRRYVENKPEMQYVYHVYIKFAYTLEVDKK